MWKKFDLNGDGFIDRKEFATVLTELNKDWTEATAYQMLGAYDTNGDGQLSYQEFFDWLFDEGRWYRKESKSKPGTFYYVNADTKEKSWSWPPYKDSTRKASTLLENMDTDGDGVITPTEFIAAMLTLDQDGDGNIKRKDLPVTSLEAEDLFKALDTETREWFLGSGAESETKLNGAYHPAGMHNSKPFYLNQHGAKICYESLPADWGFRHLPPKEKAKWTVSFGKERHYYTPAADKTSPSPLVGLPWLAVQYQRTGPRFTGDFQLEQGMQKPKGGDGFLDVNELAEAFKRLDQDGSGGMDIEETQALSALQKHRSS